MKALDDIISEYGLEPEVKTQKFYFTGRNFIKMSDDDRLVLEYNFPRNLQVIDLNSITCPYPYKIFFNDVEMSPGKIYYPILPYVTVKLEVYVEVSEISKVIPISFTHIRLSQDFTDLTLHEGGYIHSGGTIKRDQNY